MDSRLVLQYSVDLLSLLWLKNKVIFILHTLVFHQFEERFIHQINRLVKGVLSHKHISHELQLQNLGIRVMVLTGVIVSYP